MRLPGVSTELTPKAMDNIFSDLKRIPNTKRTVARFQNWEKNGAGIWQKMESSGKEDKVKSILAPPVHTITKDDTLQNTETESTS